MWTGKIVARNFASQRCKICAQSNAGVTLYSNEEVTEVQPWTQLNAAPSGMKTGHRPTACAWP